MTAEPRKNSFEPGQRLVSLDAYRGFVMLAMVSGGLGLSAVADHFEGNVVWAFLGYQFSHVSWGGCSFWDLIQPSFMFIVGVAMPYSYASRRSHGHTGPRLWAHVLYRAVVLILLGVFLRSNGHMRTNWTFIDVVSQIGLGYAFVYMVLGRPLRLQAIAAACILIGYWLLFALWPTPGEGFDAAAAGVPEDWQRFTGFAAHWNPHVNPAAAFNRWFLNLFPRDEPFTYNPGGYATLNFIPSMGTMILGVMAGELLRGSRPLEQKIRRLALAGVTCLAFGLAVDGRIWPVVDWDWSIAPIVKRIWTPSWVVFSSGWTLLMLAAFVWVIDLRGRRRWAFPLVVVGMNSVAMYVMSWLMKGWAVGTLKTHLGQGIFSGTYGPILQSVAGTLLLWTACLWLYRRRVFIRI